MLNAKKHVQDKDTCGDESSGYGVIKMQKIYEMHYLDSIDASSSYMAHKLEVGSHHKAQYGKRIDEIQLQFDINRSPCGR